MWTWRERNTTMWVCLASVVHNVSRLSNQPGIYLWITQYNGYYIIRTTLCFVLLVVLFVCVYDNVCVCTECTYCCWQVLQREIQCVNVWTSETRKTTGTVFHAKSKYWLVNKLTLFCLLKLLGLSALWTFCFEMGSLIETVCNVVQQHFDMSAVLWSHQPWSWRPTVCCYVRLEKVIMSRL